MYDSSKMTIEERISARTNYNHYSVKNAYKVRFERNYEKGRQVYKDNKQVEINARTSVFTCIHYLFDHKGLLTEREYSIFESINENCRKWGKISLKQLNLVKRFAYLVQERRRK